MKEPCQKEQFIIFNKPVKFRFVEMGARQHAYSFGESIHTAK